MDALLKEAMAQKEAKDWGQAQALLKRLKQMARPASGNDRDSGMECRALALMGEVHLLQQQPALALERFLQVHHSCVVTHLLPSLPSELLLLLQVIVLGRHSTSSCHITCS